MFAAENLGLGRNQDISIVPMAPACTIAAHQKGVDAMQALQADEA